MWQQQTDMETSNHKRGVTAGSVTWPLQDTCDDWVPAWVAPVRAAPGQRLLTSDSSLRLASGLGIRGLYSNVYTSDALKDAMNTEQLYHTTATQPIYSIPPDCEYSNFISNTLWDWTRHWVSSAHNSIRADPSYGPSFCCTTFFDIGLHSVDSFAFPRIMQSL